MYVAALRDFLRSLAQPLKASGANAAVLNDLDATADGLGPFAEMKFADLAELLAQAREYRDTGLLPVRSAAARGPSPRPKAAKPPALGVDDAVALVRRLLDDAADEANSQNALAEALKPLDALGVKDLEAVGKEFGQPKAKTKAKALEALKDLVGNRKSMHDRGRSIHI